MPSKAISSQREDEERARTDDDEHAEHNSFLCEFDRRLLPNATIYTTLEPCTREVRSKPLECCTEQILQAEVKKVFIGILDPNQGVRGKGLWELQSRGIEVELFPPDLAKEIRALNERFIRFQQTLGAEIIQPTPLQTIEVTKTATGGLHGKCEVICKCANDPDVSIRIITEREGKWWPAGESLRRIGETRNWKATVFFGVEGDHTIHIVKATSAGEVLLSYYHNVVTSNESRLDELKHRCRTANLAVDFLRDLPGSFQGIRMGHLPKGLESQAHVQVKVIRRDRAIAAEELVQEVPPAALLAFRALSEELGCDIRTNVRIPTRGGWIRFDGAFRQGEDVVGVDIYQLGTAATGVPYFQVEYLANLVPTLAFERFRRCIPCCVVVSDAPQERDDETRRRLEEILGRIPSMVKMYRLEALEGRYKT